MAKISIPESVKEDVHSTFRQIIDTLDRQEIAIGTDVVKNLREGELGVQFEGNTPYLYIRARGGLFKTGFHFVSADPRKVILAKSS